MQTESNHPFRPLDPGRVTTTEPAELQHWCKELHCTEPELMRAMAKVGEHVAALRDELGTRR